MKQTDKQGLNRTAAVAVAVIVAIVVVGLIVFDMHSESAGANQYPPGIVRPPQNQIDNYEAAHPLPGPGDSPIPLRLGASVPRQVASRTAKP